MKHQIYRSICLLAICALAACGKKSEPPKTVVSPTPLASTSPTPQAAPAVPTTPAPNNSPTVQSPKPTIAELPKSLYPSPTPVAIPLPAQPKATPTPLTTPAASEIDRDKANSKTEPISKLRLPKDSSQEITTTGIGMAKIGMTFKELKNQIGQGFEFPIKTNFIEGYDAIAVTKGKAVHYYIPYPTGTQFTDTDRIQHLMTDNPNYRTEQGVGPGTSIGLAAKVYGNATLSLSKENESREFINFSQHPSGLAFRPKPAKSRNFAGDYPESNDDYLKTQKYDSAAAIGQITVSCADEQCSDDGHNHSGQAQTQGDATPTATSQSQPTNKIESAPTTKSDTKPAIEVKDNSPVKSPVKLELPPVSPSIPVKTEIRREITDFKPSPRSSSTPRVPTLAKNTRSRSELQLETRADLKSTLNLDTRSEIKVESQPEVKLETKPEPTPTVTP